jgi:hypothetical protein
LSSATGFFLPVIAEESLGYYRGSRLIGLPRSFASRFQQRAASSSLSKQPKIFRLPPMLMQASQPFLALSQLIPTYFDVGDLGFPKYTLSIVRMIRLFKEETRTNRVICPRLMDCFYGNIRYFTGLSEVVATLH